MPVVIWHWREVCVQLMVFVPVQLKMCCGSRKNKVLSASPVLKDLCQYGCLTDACTRQGCGDLAAGPAVTLLVAPGERLGQSDPWMPSGPSHLLGGWSVRCLQQVPRGLFRASLWEFKSSLGTGV